MHGLPLTYNKDMQEDKERLFDACDTLELCLDAADGMISTITFDRSRLAAAASDQMLAATDIADLLVRRGMPFREAHGVVAGLVRVAVQGGSGCRSSRVRSWPRVAAARRRVLRAAGRRGVARVEGVRGRDQPRARA